MKQEHEDFLRKLALNDEGTIGSVFAVAIDGADPSWLDGKTYALVRLAGLIAVGSSPASYQWSVAASIAAGATDDEIIDVLTALAPIVGLARVNAATPEVALAIGCDLDVPG
ncbi:MAG: carboxymuconolactone decarboxylase family protein [Acidimicrobiales bacterium]